MKRTTIEHSDLWKIAHALRVAANRFTDDANMCAERLQRAPTSDFFRSLKQQFDWQAAEARRWAELIEEGDRLVVEAEEETADV